MGSNVTNYCCFYFCCIPRGQRRRHGGSGDPRTTRTLAPVSADGNEDGLLFERVACGGEAASRRQDLLKGKRHKGIWAHLFVYAIQGSCTPWEAFCVCTVPKAHMPRFMFFSSQDISCVGIWNVGSVDHAAPGVFALDHDSLHSVLQDYHDGLIAGSAVDAGSVQIRSSWH